MWEEEKEAYKIKEVGTGVQNFVKKILEANELFNLKEGNLKTKEEKRKGEFIHEKSTKERRQADFVIYVDSDIKIPIEVECYTHIKKGETQLRDYQKDLEKKYGLLTDGYYWRFYNNETVEQEFTIVEILENTALFLTFWEEYIKPIHYYATYFEGETKELPVDSNRGAFFEDTTFLIKNFKNKLQIEGYFKALEEKEKNKEAIQLAYSYLIQFILYKTLVDNEFDKFREKYHKNLNLVSEYIKNKRFRDIFSIIEGISNNISKNIYKPFKHEQSIIDEKLREVYRKSDIKLSDISPWLDIFVYIKKYTFKNIQNEIFGFIYENYLKELFSEEERGQYFTDPNVVNFMIKEIGYSIKNIKNKVEDNQENKISIIDPSCGSGTFLHTATDSIAQALADGLRGSKKVEDLVTNNIFGLDIEEFPLYLAEMSILMRLLPLIITEKYNNPFDKKIKLFLTKDSISEFQDVDLDDTEVDVAIKGGQTNLNYFLDPDHQSFMRDKGDLKEMKYSLSHHGNIPRRRFDFVIGNPPYIGYNKCSQQGVLIFNLMKERKAKLNDIYGVNLHSIPGNPKRYRPNPNLYSFFIALGLALLKDDGKLCYIIPQTILTAGDLDVIRYHLSKFTTIEKIITFSGFLFTERGLKQRKTVPTSSLIFLVKKKKPLKNNKVKIVNYNGDDSSVTEVINKITKNKETSTKEILQIELLENARNWNFLTQDLSSINFNEDYIKNSENISKYYKHKLAIKEFNCLFYFDSGYSIDEKNFLDDPLENNLNYQFPKIDENILTIKDFVGFWPNIRSGNSKLTIKLRQANQGYKLLDSKFKIIWSYINPFKFHFTSKQVIWARNRYCSIGSDCKDELLYLFALLNSKIINRILKFNLKTETERDFLVSTSSIKEYVRVPKIISKNQYIKKEIIKVAEELLNLEENKLSNFVDLSGIMMQKIDEIKSEKNNLILIRGSDIIERKIKSNSNSVKVTIDSLNSKKDLTLSDIKNLIVVDKDKQEVVKKYLDDLTFALYFRLDIKKIGLNYADGINKICKKNKFYNLLSSS